MSFRGLLNDDEKRCVICRHPMPGVSHVLHPKQDGALYWLVVSNNFHSYLGKISNLTNIFQMGGNHQLVKDGFLLFF